MRGRSRKFGEDTVTLCVRIPASWKRMLEEFFGCPSEVVRELIEKKLMEVDPRRQKTKLLQEQQELLSRLREIDQSLKKLEELCTTTETDRDLIKESFEHIVKALSGNNGWRAELTPEEAAKVSFRAYTETTGLDPVTARKKVLSVYPELEGVI